MILLRSSRCAPRVRVSRVVGAAAAALLLATALLRAQQAPDPVNFDWRAFGRQAVEGADYTTRRRLAQSAEERVQFIAAEVGRQLNALRIMPNTNFVERGVSWTRHGSQALGTCEHVTDSLKDALVGAGVDERRLLRVFGEKRGAQSLNLFDVNRNHMALAYVREDGQVASYDLWAHGGEHGTFGRFDGSVWAGQDLATWSKVMERYGYGRQACEDCLDRNLNVPYLFLEAVADQVAMVAQAQRVVPTGAIRFVVKDNATGDPLGNARIVVDGAINSPVERIRVTGTTDGTGTATIGGIVEGPYTVTTSHANCPAYTSGMTHLTPRDTRTIRVVCQPTPIEQGPAERSKMIPGLFGDRPAAPAKPGGGQGDSDDQVAAEYRTLLPAVLQAERRPWHTRFDIKSNAVKTAGGYYVNYHTYCVTEQGPDKGKDHKCFEFDGVLSPGQLRAAVADFKKRLGR